MIRLVVVDVDGVLSQGEAAPLDFAVLQRLAELNDGACQDPAYPAVTVCTGRPVRYVEVLMQAIHGRHISVRRYQRRRSPRGWKSRRRNGPWR
jgi:3-deoxy-D-manno-octulosonate 8-phosphate phosphatase KdsC-like HAD superfamily phosphatase